MGAGESQCNSWGCCAPDDAASMSRETKMQWDNFREIPPNQGNETVWERKSLGTGAWGIKRGKGLMSEFDQKTQDFHDAARAGDAPKIERMIRFVGMDPDEELNGLSPIHVDMSSLSLLLSSCPRQVAAAAGHCEATQALLR
eukprot:753776-Hanusia_phi.AAC.4